jgi:hypothetical protein
MHEREILEAMYRKHHMEKEAFIPIPLPSTGGGSYVTNHGLGVEAGYNHILGVLPVPEVGLRYGDEDGGITLSGPIPGIGIDNGTVPGKWNWNRNRSLWQYLKDKYQGEVDIDLEDGTETRISEQDYDKLEKYKQAARRALEEGDDKALNAASRKYYKVYDAIVKQKKE